MIIPELIPMIRTLIASPSVSSVNAEWDQSNQGVIESLHAWTKSLGFNVETLAIPGQTDKYNLVASIGSGPDGLVLSGHTDTVPFDDNRWTSSPFKLHERDNRLYGLGTSDMKAFFALALEAIKDLPLQDIKKPLTLLATCDEESTMCGAQTLVDTGRQFGRHAIIGEPTGLRPIRMHKGIAMESIRVFGQSGHSSDPSLGTSALEGMHQLISELLVWRSELQQRYQNPAFAVAVPTLNLGHIHGGDNPNRICAECELQIDLRPLPGMNLETLRQELDQRLAPLMSERGLRYERKALFPGVPPMETPAEAAIIKVTEQLTGYPAEAVAFGTEGPYLNQLGMETVILGPGDIDQAHQPDEYLALDRLQPMVDILRKLVIQHCF